MRLKAIALKNFRCFTNEVIGFDRYTALVGANNAGKSAAIAAIDIFFRSNPKSIPVSIDDFFRRVPDQDLEIRLTFSDLSNEAETEFSHYMRSGELSFFIRSRISTGIVSSSLHGTRFGNPGFAPFFKMASAAEKKSFYEVQQAELNLPKWQNQTQAAEALRAFEAENPSQNAHIPSDDNAFGVEGPVSRLRKYIDFVYIPAVKDAGEEAIEARNTAFTRLIDRAVRANLKIEERLEKIRKDAKTEIDAISENHQEALADLTTRIENEYKKFNAAESRLHLDWGKFEEKNLQINLPAVKLEVSDDLIRNTITKFGHGTQRNYLMALLLVSATYDFSSLQTMIVGCEEPELYQHPPQARKLAEAFYALANSTTQIIIATHSPHFIAARSFENIRLVRREIGQRSKVYNWSIDEHCSLIAKAKNEDPIGTKAARAALNQFLQPELNEMFFAPAIVFVEGSEDRALLGRYLQLSGRYAAALSKGIHIVPVSRKGNLINAISIARGFQIPFFVVFDGDMNCKADDMARNIKQNKDIMATLDIGVEANDGKFDAHFWSTNVCVWKDTIQEAFEDLEVWNNEKLALAQEFGWTIGRLKKNPMLLEAALERVHSKGKIPHLEKVSSKILEAFEPKGDIGSELSIN